MSSKAGLVHFLIVKSAKVLHCELNLNVFLKKRIYKKLCAVCSEIPFGEDSCRIETCQIDLQF